MTLLIDGYNLLNAVGIVGRGTGRTSLERSRLALLNFLADRLDPAEAEHTTIVFDSTGAPPGLPRALNHRGLHVRFAPRGSDADTVLEELIHADNTPRRMTVVSSDHRIQRAAKRRRARAVDSDVWYDEIVHRPSTPPVPTAVASSGMGNKPLTDREVQRWLAEFGGEASLEQVAHEEPSPVPAHHLPHDTANVDIENEKSDMEISADLLNPFPPGYGEDLLRDSDADR
jgi:predicted RNA-binding protein with PIN domain